MFGFGESKEQVEIREMKSRLDKMEEKLAGIELENKFRDGGQLLSIRLLKNENWGDAMYLAYKYKYRYLHHSESVFGNEVSFMKKEE